MMCISSKYPNPYLYECIQKIYDIQNPTVDYEIHVVDSDSEKNDDYRKVKDDFPDVHIHYIKNKHYEYGAWKYILETYPSFDTYFCIQDSIHIHSKMDITKVNNHTAYSFHCNVGYLNFEHAKEYSIGCLELGGLSSKSVDTYFTISTHNSFVVSKNTLEDMFRCLIVPPETKFGSCSYERLFGIFFLEKNIYTIDMAPYVNKNHGGRL